jgi:hypothetical protein
VPAATVTAAAMMLIAGFTLRFPPWPAAAATIPISHRHRCAK